MSVLKIKDQNGNWQDIPAIKGADGAIQYRAGTNIQINNNTISTSGLNQTQVQDLIDASIEALGELGFTPTVVEELPSEDIDTHTIYLVPKQDSEQEDAYDEWLYINNAWEHIGSTTIDLSNYYTKSEVNGLIPSVPVYYFDIGVDAGYYSTAVYVSTEARSTLGSILTEAYSKGYRFVSLLVTNSGGKLPILFGVPDGITAIDITTKPTRFSIGGVHTMQDGRGEVLTKITLYANVTWNGDTAAVSSCYLTRRNRIVVDIENEQTITSKKIFSILPESSVTPTTNNQLVNKSYVDTAISTAITDALGGSY